jgi:hypothetical protein
MLRKRKEGAVSETEHSRQAEGEHPEVDRSYDREKGGQVPEGQGNREDYVGPDPEDESAVAGDDEDQGI